MSERGQAGFTLVELLVSTSIMGLVVTLVGTGLFLSMVWSEKVNYAVLAQLQTRLALQWMARDLPMAQSTSLADGAAPVPSATFTWVDQFADAQTPHSLSYSLNGGELSRTYDGVTNSIARQIVALSFERSGRLITATVSARPNNRYQTTDQKMLMVALRAPVQ